MGSTFKSYLNKDTKASSKDKESGIKKEKKIDESYYDLGDFEEFIRECVKKEIKLTFKNLNEMVKASESTKQKQEKPIVEPKEKDESVVNKASALVDGELSESQIEAIRSRIMSTPEQGGNTETPIVGNTVLAKPHKKEITNHALNLL